MDSGVYEHPSSNPHADKLTGVELSENRPAVHAAEQPLRVLDGQERLKTVRGSTYGGSE